MADTGEPQNQEIQGNPFDLAMIVADRVELETVFLLESHIWRNPSLSLPNEHPDIEFGISQTAHGKDVENKTVFVKIDFVSSDTGLVDGKASIYSIKATFVLIYNISSFAKIDDHNIWAFSMTTGIYNAWPYWREFLQNTTTRMGLPPVIAPPFRFTSKNTENSK